VNKQGNYRADKFPIYLFRNIAMKKIAQLIIILIATMMMSACISTSVKGYTDNSHKNYKIKKIAIHPVNTNMHFTSLLEESMVDELEDVGVAAKSFSVMFPPTRQRTEKEVNEKLLEKGFDSIMHIHIGSSKHASSSSDLHLYDPYSGGVSHTNITTFNRNTTAQIKIISVKNNEVIWIGDTQTAAGGLLYIGDESTTDSIAEDLIETLKEIGHL